MAWNPRETPRDESHRPFACCGVAGRRRHDGGADRPRLRIRSGEGWNAARGLHICRHAPAGARRLAGPSDWAPTDISHTIRTRRPRATRWPCSTVRRKPTSRSPSAFCLAGGRRAGGIVWHYVDNQHYYASVLDLSRGEISGVPSGRRAAVLAWSSRTTSSSILRRGTR